MATHREDPAQKAGEETISISEATDVSSFEEFCAQNLELIALFTSDESEPCSLMEDALRELAEESEARKVIKVEAGKVTEVTQRYNVTAVPTTVFISKGKELDRIEGFQPAALFEIADKLKPVDLTTRLKQLTTAEAVMLFMKGTPQAPRCGFSSKVVQALQQENIPFGTFDILTDQEVRQGMKEYSDWPTFPQLYVGGEMLGGCDIVMELSRQGELTAAVEEAAHEMQAGLSIQISKDGEALKSSSGAEDIEQRITKLLSSAPVLLLMKGSPDFPQCGFSKRVVDTLRSQNIHFDHFDILQDEQIRQGVKKFSDWPTYPQLYVKSELIGGCDIILEMAKTGELLACLQEGA